MRGEFRQRVLEPSCPAIVRRCRRVGVRATAILIGSERRKRRRQRRRLTPRSGGGGCCCCCSDESREPSRCRLSSQATIQKRRGNPSQASTDRREQHGREHRRQHHRPEVGVVVRDWDHPRSGDDERRQNCLFSVPPLTSAASLRAGGSCALVNSSAVVPVRWRRRVRTTSNCTCLPIDGR